MITSNNKSGNLLAISSIAISDPPTRGLKAVVNNKIFFDSWLILC